MKSKFEEVLNKHDELEDLRQALKRTQLALARSQRKTADNVENMKCGKMGNLSEHIRVGLIFGVYFFQ